MTARRARTRRPVRWVAAIAGAALASGLLATQPTASAAATGGISGAVTDDADAPLAGIEVVVFDDTGMAETVVGSDVTDETGTYLVDGIFPGDRYRVRFRDPAGEWATEFYDDSLTPPPWVTWVPVVAGSTVPDVDAVLEPGSAISGRFTIGPDDTPVDGGTVQVLWSPSAGSRISISFHRTDPDGHWSAPGLRAGTYFVNFGDPATGAHATWDDADSLDPTPIVVTSGVDVTGIDAHFDKVVTATPPLPPSPPSAGRRSARP